MKWSQISKMKSVKFATFVAFVLISLSFAGGALTSDIRDYNPDYSTGINQQYVIRPAQLECSVPDGWQANWRGKKLSIAKLNSDGTAANGLEFRNLESLYDWIESHPDFCDVSVENYVKHINEEQ